MTFRLIPFNITGPSYQSRSKPLSSQQTVNWYQQFNDEGKDNFVLLPFPGLKQLGSFDTELLDRGMWRMKEIAYQVKGNSLYVIDKFGNHTRLGFIPNTDRVIMSDDGINLIIITGGDTYIYSSDTNALKKSTIIVNGARSVDYLNDNFLFTFDEFTLVAVFDNVAKDFVSEGQIGAITKPDDIVRDFVFEQTVWRMGVRTIEGWYNNPNVNPPISRLEGQIFDVGLAALHSVAQTDEAFYWLGDDNAIYRARAGTKDRISTDAISNAISQCTHISDAYAYTFTMEGQNFYAINFCPDNLTLVVNESLGKKGWFELSSGIDDERYQGSSLLSVYGKSLLADESNGKVYELDFDTYTNDSETLKRTRIATSINGDLLGAKGKRVQMSRFEFIMETGEGLISGQGDNPRVMIEASYDGGRSWSHGTWARVGRMGEHVLKVEWFNLNTFYDCILRISTTDPVNYSIYSGTVELRLAGQ